MNKKRVALLLGGIVAVILGVVVMAAHPAFAQNYWIRNDLPKIKAERALERRYAELEKMGDAVAECANERWTYSAVIGYQIAYSKTTDISNLIIYIAFHNPPGPFTADPEGYALKLNQEIDVLLKCALDNPGWSGMTIVSNTVDTFITYDDMKPHLRVRMLGAMYMGMYDIVQSYYDEPYDTRYDLMEIYLATGKMAQDQKVAVASMLGNPLLAPPQHIHKEWVIDFATRDYNWTKENERLLLEYRQVELDKRRQEMRREELQSHYEIDRR